MDGRDVPRFDFRFCALLYICATWLLVPMSRRSTSIGSSWSPLIRLRVAPLVRLFVIILIFPAVSLAMCAPFIILIPIVSVSLSVAFTILAISSLPASLALSPMITVSLPSRPSVSVFSVPFIPPRGSMTVDFAPVSSWSMRSIVSAFPLAIFPLRSLSCLFHLLFLLVDEETLHGIVVIVVAYEQCKLSFLG